MRQIVTFSLRRSGQHAVIHWLLTANQPSQHYNNCNKYDLQNITSVENYKRNPQRYGVKKPQLSLYSVEDFNIVGCKGVERVAIIRSPDNLKA